MNRSDHDLDRILDQTLDGIRDEQPDPQFVNRASDAVWNELEAAARTKAEAAAGPRHIQSCSDFQSLLPAFVGGELEGAKKLLVQDHLGECVPCRRAFKQIKAKRVRVARPASATGDKAGSWVSRWGIRVAAAAVIFVALFGISVDNNVLSFETGGLIHIEAIEGEAFQVTDEGNVPLQVGQTLKLEQGEGIRTAKGSSAVISLADQSRVEVAERSELAVLEKRSLIPGRRADGVIDLERGSVIIEASDQGSGHLNVRTNDCDVAVTGTVFAVNHGVKGSRVSVVEGEVHVKYDGNRDVLHAGQQTTTKDSLDRIPVEQDIAWSQNSERYIELLQELRELSKEIDQAFQPGLRYDTSLLDRAPADTVIYFAMPNVTEELGQAYGMLQSRMQTNEVLRQWWEGHMTQGHSAEIEEFIDKIATFGDHLGEEVVMTLQVDSDGQSDGPLFLAELTNQNAFMSMLREEIERLAIEHPDEDMRVFLIENELPVFPVPEPRNAMYFWAHDGLLAMAPDSDRLLALSAVEQQIPGSRLQGGTFHGRLTDVYSQGVEWAVGIDLEHLIRADNENERNTLEKMGVLDAQHMIGERKQLDGSTENRVVMTFSQPRRNLAAWLAEPGPIGAMSYISPDANLAAAFVMQDMGILVDELFDLVGTEDRNFDKELDEFEREQGIDIRRDFAAPLGGEVAMALDGPVLPKPSWKLIVEVYDSARLQQTLEWLVTRINDEARQSEFAGLNLEQEQVGSREYFRLESLDTGLEVHYVFDDGYCVFAPSRAMLDRALQSKRTGINLPDAPDFVELLPKDGQIHFSGALYHNLGSVLGPLSRTLGSAGMAEMSPDQQSFIRQLATDAKPGLALIYGERDRIVATSKAEGGLLTSGLNSLSGFGSLLGMQQSLIQTLQEQSGN